ncbi:hypothetical protein P168DRAFT_33376 [Aspergillus campestris IBT 28561]|uniref:Uncharacterized protein n=1 Tax=Aspergillus campestris (strain IBT 28561) TaxID=1392248 RepID=A0A2I1DH98_ASPC2|nr:uncharacterized protein P168DRAFT_33376 [Aspergillus campestris IBT 28561]PKY09252.1 hypothetical protein P168DRAFT_33376 [Aspergillus campestris IBT 28561]
MLTMHAAIKTQFQIRPYQANVHLHLPPIWHLQGGVSENWLPESPVQSSTGGQLPCRCLQLKNHANRSWGEEGDRESDNWALGCRAAARPCQGFRTLLALLSADVHSVCATASHGRVGHLVCCRSHGCVCMADEKGTGFRWGGGILPRGGGSIGVLLLGMLIVQ